MLSIAPNCGNQVCRVLAGAIGWIDEQLSEMGQADLPSLGQADLVVAVLEKETPQTWHNATRAIQAAAAIASEDATIVLWSSIADPIPAVSQDVIDGEQDEVDTQTDAQIEGEQPEAIEDDEDFPAWNADVVVARELAELASRFRLLIRSELENEVVELAGFGAISDADQINRLSQGFDVGCVLRRAAYLAPAATELSSFRLEK